MTHSQTHGLVSLALIGGCVILGAAAMFLEWWMLGVAYLSSSVIAAFSIVYGFCSKCPSQDQCGHLLPGRLARVFRREPSPCTALEIATVAVACLILFGVPQLYLWRQPALFVIFWGMAIFAGIKIRCCVCPACANRFCPAYCGKSADDGRKS